MALAPVVMIKAVLGFLDNADMASFSVCNSVLTGIVTTEMLRRTMDNQIEAWERDIAKEAEVMEEDFDVRTYLFSRNLVCECFRTTFPGHSWPDCKSMRRPLPCGGKRKGGNYRWRCFCVYFKTQHSVPCDTAFGRLLDRHDLKMEHYEAHWQRGKATFDSEATKRRVRE